jgi:hypothetical protein
VKICNNDNETLDYEIKKIKNKKEEFCGSIKIVICKERGIILKRGKS